MAGHKPALVAGTASGFSRWGLLARYRTVFTAAWAARHDLAGPQRLREEIAFLPDALRLQDTPVHPAPRRFALAICAFFVLAVAWSVVGRLDIVAVADGRIVVSERTKTIQPLEAGVIQRVLVREGDQVSAGQVLVELDPTAARADGRSVAEMRAAAMSEGSRAQALLDALDSGRPPQPSAERPGGASQTSFEGERLAAEWKDIRSRLTQAEAEQVRRSAEAATVREAITRLEALLPMARQREADVRALADQGFMNQHASQDRTRERIEAERDLALQRARLAEAEAAQAESAARAASLVAEARRSLQDRLAKARLDLEQLASEADKTRQREGLTRLTAPVDGTVQQLAIHTPGGVVTPAQVLMVVVPRSGEVSADVVVQNKDIGFVHVGQAAEVKLESFPFTRYGTVPATVIRISADAVNDERRGAVFLATLRLHSPELDLGGRTVRLTPGMNLTAEIKTGRRRVIDYLLAPVEATVDSSLKER